MTTPPDSTHATETSSAPPAATAPDSTFMDSAVVTELVAIGAAVGSNCAACLKHHIDKARQLGVSDDDMARAVATAQAVKQAPAQITFQTADTLLDGAVSQIMRAHAGGCCGGSNNQCGCEGEA